MNTPTEVHRLFYDAIETGDVDLMATLWVDDPDTSCVHLGATPLRGTPQVLRSWTVLMASLGYIQFFLTDVDVVTLPRGSADPDTAVITCTEDVLSAEGMALDADAFAGGRTVSTSIVVRVGGAWRLWSRHASLIATVMIEEDD